MNISKEQIDDLNAVLTVAVVKGDYAGKVEEILKDYRKKANIPGFRKGHVPIGLLRKQYGQSIRADEVNRLVGEELSKYLFEEKLDFLGNPIPRKKADFSWEDDEYAFEFEVGLAPSFELKWKTKKAIPSYHIKVDTKDVDEQISRIRHNSSSLIDADTVSEEAVLSGNMHNDVYEVSDSVSFDLKDVADKKSAKLLMKGKVEDSFEFPYKGLFHKDRDPVLKSDTLNIDNYKGKIAFDLKEIKIRELPALDQDFFDKHFGKGKIKTEQEMRDFIEEYLQSSYEHQAQQKLLRDASTALMDNTKFDLPESFLVKWIKMSEKEEISMDVAQEHYNSYETSLRWQLIENKIKKDNDIVITQEEINEEAERQVRQRLGDMNVDSLNIDVNNIVKSYLEQENKVKELSDQIFEKKLLVLVKEKSNLKTKKLTYEEFLKK